MDQGKICVSLAGADAADVYNQARLVLDEVDVVEVRLDSMAIPEVAKCCSLLRKPLIFTNRPVREGGKYDGPEDERIKALLDAIQLQATYIDLELRTDTQLRDQLLEAMNNKQTRMIISWHDFESTPPADDLSEILEKMIDSGAQIGKIVTTAHVTEDVLRVLHLQEQAKAANFPLSSFCMGESGRISRLATLYLGGYMTYASLNDEQATAAGQLSVYRLRELTSLLSPG